MSTPLQTIERSSQAADALALDGVLSGVRGQPVETVLRALVDGGFDLVPLPAGGATVDRWRVLARVAAEDLVLVKLFEAHVDALAILAEIEPERAASTPMLYGVWASEAPVDPITIDHGASSTIRGRKSWCSGAAVVDRALMTAVDADGGRFIVEIGMDDPGITIDRSRWHAVGMRGSGSYDVVCEAVEARIVGRRNAYLDRPGFWHGGMGIAACWHGAAAAMGHRVRELQRAREDVHALAHLGAIDAGLACSAALLRECAVAIDRRPRDDAMHRALRVRNAVADIAETVLDHAARAIGPGPLCSVPDVARRFSDLPIFVRQSRAEHDRVGVARALLAQESEEPAWTL